MKKTALLLLLAACFSMPAIAGDGPRPIKLISYNLRNSGARDGDNAWMKRRHATPQMIRQEAPDVFGVQEGLIDQLQYIDTECPQYVRVGVGRDDGAEGGEIMAIYYLRDRFELVDSGTLWLSETPAEVSRGWDGACNRTMTWVELRDKNSGKEFFYFNTHLDHRGKIAREESVKLIVGEIQRIAGPKGTAVLGGDFNTRQRPVFALLEHMESTGLCRFIPLHGTFHKNGRWQAEDGGQLMYCDDNHLSPYGAKKMVGGIIDQLFPGMERTAAN